MWGNRFDLSLNIGKKKSVNENEDPLKTIVSLDPFILADDTDDIWNILNCSNNKKSKIIGKVLVLCSYCLTFIITYC